MTTTDSYTSISDEDTGQGVKLPIVPLIIEITNLNQLTSFSRTIDST